jgi:hypothetical protein
MLKHKKRLIALSIIPQIIFLKILEHYPNFVESAYSQGIYIWISKAMRYAFGWLPFSVGDILYTVLGLYILRWFYVNRKRIIKDTKHWVLDILSALSVGYFAFHILWAFNYYRLHHGRIGRFNTTTHQKNKYVAITACKRRFY